LFNLDERVAQPSENLGNEANMVGAKLKIAILYDVWEDGKEIVEAPAEKKPKPKKTKKEKEDREEIFEALAKLGHSPFYQVLDGTPQCLQLLAKCDADLIFNLTESFAGDDTKEMNIAAYLDLIGIPYTGAGPHANFLAQDKGTAKKMFAFHGIKTPYFATSYRGRIDWHRLRRGRSQRQRTDGANGIHSR
jgi:D-alanine-D-alanine ligase